MGSDWTSPPCDAMPSNRRNPTLDEQSFQGLLSAAYTIQEHNARMNQTVPVQATPEPRPEPEPTSVCQHCGATTPDDASQCKSCGTEDYRPGEKLQRNWASMWLLSQEQGLWPERSSEAREAARTSIPSIDQGRLRVQAGQDVSDSDIAALPVASDLDQETILTEKTASRPDRKRGKSKSISSRSMSSKSMSAKSMSGKLAPSKSVPEESAVSKLAFGDSTLEEPILNESTSAEAALAPSMFDNAAVESNWIREGLTSFGEERLTQLDSGQADFISEQPDPSAQQFDLSAIDDSFPTEPAANATIDGGSWLGRLKNAHVKLLFHRADLYLGMAVFVAALALFWPAVSSPQPATLGLWDRALIAVGIAEAPVPAAHVQGDPTIEVWVDPHTALYYCPGEEQYGKTTDGRLTSQREAQMESFEAAGRLACE